ncbi:F-box/WD repeat-containing protein 7 [Orchesella cincta]|uniref:F-box/WD repeat-containing protein 7 n=1 Tax=Orchesella cincta TaxID=48709 RepID=A0A1D2N589_ORCCI|nr:F-box/WD repeat-containing protein 7 [Orchesella cincta]
MDTTESSSSLSDGSSILSTIPSTDYPAPRMGEWLQIFSNWSNPERLMAINELVGVCGTSEVRHMMELIEPLFQRDFISLLPKELALYILSFLDPRDLSRAAQTCKYWQIISEDNLLWREKCKEAGIGYFSAMSSRVHKRRSNADLSSDGDTDLSNTNWKTEFVHNQNIEMNWRSKDTRNPSLLRGHDDHVITCIQFSEDRIIVSGSDDNSLKVWCVTTGKCLRTLLGHIGGVWSAQMSGTTIISGSTDRTIRVWNAETGQCLHTLHGHTSTVRCMKLHGNRVVSGSRDATVRVWDVETGECQHVLVGHLSAVRCVQYNGHLVVSGSYDFSVRVWDPESELCLHQLSGHANRIYTLQFDGIHVISGSLDSTIKVWDVKTGTLKHTLTGHSSLTSVMEIRNNLLISGNADSTAKIWDISTGQCIFTLRGLHKHSSSVTSLQIVHNFVITSSDDGTVKLWNIRTGKSLNI